jgi:bifunctional non-homologous end joining protein LigD
MRRGNDWTDRFKEIANEADRRQLGDHRWRGRCARRRRHHRFLCSAKQLRGKSDQIVTMAFDLLYLNGYDLRKLPLLERKTHLKKLIAKTAIQFSESFEIDRKSTSMPARPGLRVSCPRCGTASTRPAGAMIGSRKPCAQRETLTIAGFAMEGSKWNGLYLARRKGDDLIYAGKVDHGFDKDSAKELQAKLKPLIREPRPTVSALRIVAYGLSRRCWRRTSIGRSRRGQGPASVLQGTAGGFVTAYSTSAGRGCRSSLRAGNNLP